MERAKVDLSLAQGEPTSPCLQLPRNPFPFLKLEPELRIYIYRLLYRRESQIWLTGHVAHHCGSDKIETGLLLSCRKIYNEASAVLYDMNAFAVNGRAGLEVILEKLGTQACTYLRTIKIWSIPLEFSELERQLVCANAPLPSLHKNLSVWNCVAFHLKKLQTIELGTFRNDLLTAVLRLTSSIKLVNRGQPPPTIELEVREHVSASTMMPPTGSLGHEGRLHALSAGKTKSLWLPSVSLIRLIGRLNTSDRKSLQQDIYDHYVVDNIEERYTSDFTGGCIGGSTESVVLITLIMCGQSAVFARLCHREVD